MIKTCRCGKRRGRLLKVEINSSKFILEALAASLQKCNSIDRRGPTKNKHPQQGRDQRNGLENNATQIMVMSDRGETREACSDSDSKDSRCLEDGIL